MFEKLPNDIKKILFTSLYDSSLKILSLVSKKLNAMVDSFFWSRQVFELRCLLPIKHIPLGLRNKIRVSTPDSALYIFKEWEEKFKKINVETRPADFSYRVTEQLLNRLNNVIYDAFHEANCCTRFYLALKEANITRIPLQSRNAILKLNPMIIVLEDNFLYNIEYDLLPFSACSQLKKIIITNNYFPLKINNTDDAKLLSEFKKVVRNEPKKLCNYL